MLLSTARLCHCSVFTRLSPVPKIRPAKIVLLTTDSQASNRSHNYCKGY